MTVTETIGAIIGAILAIWLLSSCAGMPAAAVLLPEAASAATALSGRGITVNIMSGNTTCTCATCAKMATK